MKELNDEVCAQIVKNCSTAELIPIMKRMVPENLIICSDERETYDGVVDAGQKHYSCEAY